MITTAVFLSETNAYSAYHEQKTKRMRKRNSSYEIAILLREREEKNELHFDDNKPSPSQQTWQPF